MATYVSLSQHHFGPNAGYMPHFPIVDNLINGNLIGWLAMDYVFRAQRHFDRAQALHPKAFGTSPTIGTFELLREELELMIYCMRKAIDHLIQGAALKFELQAILATGKIETDSLGRAIWERQKASTTHGDLLACFFGTADAPADPTGFLTNLNTVSNSYKHGFFLPESQGYGSPYAPTIVLFDKAGNDLRQPPVVHNHHAGHLAMGFQDTIDRLLMAFGSKPLAAKTGA